MNKAKAANRNVARSSAPRAEKKKIVVDVSVRLFEDTQAATRELRTNTSDIVRRALEQFLAKRQKERLQRELEEGYHANAEFARRIHDQWSGADADIA